MLEWIIATVIGLALGWLFYLCVRLRSPLAQFATGKFGRRGPHWIWVAMIVIMILTGNVFLIGLRYLLWLLESGRDTLAFEIWFAIVGFVLGLYLVTRRAWRQDCSFISYK